MAELKQRLTEYNAVKRGYNTVMANDFEGDNFVCRQQLASLRYHFDRFNVAQDTLVGNSRDESELTVHEALLAELESFYDTAVVRLNRQIALNGQPAVAPDHAHIPELGRAMNFKLDPVGVPKFDGSLRNWLSFKDAIQTLLNKPNIPEYYKLTKLRDSMASESLKTLVGNLYTGGFEATWNELLRRFDNPKQLAELHVSRFVGIRPVSTESSSGLLTIVDTVRESFRALRVMELPVDQWDAISVPIVTSKLPQETQHAWGMHSDPREIPKLNDLLTFVEKRAQSLSLDVLYWPGTTISDGARGSRRGTSQLPPTSTSSRRLVKSNLVASNPNHCEYCNNASHRIFRCPALLALPVTERFSKLSGSNLCFNCLKPGHPTSSCSGSHCRNCRGKHNTLLCRQTNATNASSTSSTPSTPSTSSTNAPVDEAVSSRPPHNYA